MEDRKVPRQPFANRFGVAAQPITVPAVAVVEQLRVQRLEARRPRHRHQEIPPDIADQPLHLALVVALAGPAEAVEEEVVRLQLAEHSRPLTCPIPQDARHRQGRVIVKDRLRHLPEEAERRGVPRAERLRRLRRIRLHEAGVAVRQIHREEVDLPLHAADHRHSLAEVHLRMPGIVPQRHEHLAEPLTTRQHVVLHDGKPAGVTVLVTHTLENPLRSMPLLRRTALVVFQDLVDEPDERIQLRPLRRHAAPIPWRNREHQHLGHRPRIDPEPPSRLPIAQTLDPDRVTNPPVKLHDLHPSAFRQPGKRLSAAGVLLRRNRNARPLQ